MRALFAGVVLLCAARAEQDSSKPADAHQTAQQPFHAPGASQVVDPRAIAVMRNLFSRPAAAFTSDKSILSLAQGKPLEGQPAPQTLAPFLAPYTPPATAQVSQWSNYNLMMMSFWYRFEFGFAVFQAGPAPSPPQGGLPRAPRRALLPSPARPLPSPSPISLDGLVSRAPAPFFPNPPVSAFLSRCKPRIKANGSRPR